MATTGKYEFGLVDRDIWTGQDIVRIEGPSGAWVLRREFDK